MILNNYVMFGIILYKTHDKIMWNVFQRISNVGLRIVLGGMYNIGESCTSLT